MTTIENLTDEQLGELRDASWAGGKPVLAALCARALTPNALQVEFTAEQIAKLGRDESRRINGLARTRAYAEILRLINT